MNAVTPPVTTHPAEIAREESRQKKRGREIEMREGWRRKRERRGKGRVGGYWGWGWRGGGGLRDHPGWGNEDDPLPEQHPRKSSKKKKRRGREMREQKRLWMGWLSLGRFAEAQRTLAMLSMEKVIYTERVPLKKKRKRKKRQRRSLRTKRKRKRVR
jgi:hypothetical protein